MIQITPINEEAYQLFHDGSLALAEASHNGMRINEGSIKTAIAALNVRVEDHERLFWSSGIGKLWQKVYGAKSNLRSDHQTRAILYDKLHYEPHKTTKGELPSVDYESLMAIPDPAIEHLVGSAKLSKLRDTYLKGMFRDSVGGWIHPNFNLHLVTTFRSSSDHPNFHNIPKRDKEAKELVRSVIFPRKKHQFLCADFGGIEVRISACYHKDPNMLKYINDPTSDMHKDMAIQLYELDDLDKKQSGDKHLRQAAKNGFVFPQFYGDYYGNNAVILIDYAKTCPELSNGGTILEWLSDRKLVKLNRDGGVVNYDRFINHVKDVEHDFWYKRFKVYQDWKDEYYARYQRDGYIDLLTGFRCSGVMRRNEVINYPVQGAAFHCLLWSFIKFHAQSKNLQWDSRLVGQIHDDMVVDTHPDELKEVAKLIEHITCVMLPDHWKWIIVPIEIETSMAGVDEPWGATEEFNWRKL